MVAPSGVGTKHGKLVDGLCWTGILQAHWYQVPTTLEHTSVARELVNKEQNGFFFYCCPAAGSKRPL